MITTLAKAINAVLRPCREDWVVMDWICQAFIVALIVAFVLHFHHG